MKSAWWEEDDGTCGASEVVMVRGQVGREASEERQGERATLEDQKLSTHTPNPRSAKVRFRRTSCKTKRKHVICLN